MTNITHNKPIIKNRKHYWKETKGWSLANSTFPKNAYIKFNLKLKLTYTFKIKA
jgi:hypothetical protein